MFAAYLFDQRAHLLFVARVPACTSAPAATSTPTTVAPSLRKRSTVARPIPDAAPVTIATFLASLCMAGS